MPSEREIEAMKAQVEILGAVVDRVVELSREPDYTDEQWVADKDKVLDSITILNKALRESLRFVVATVEKKQGTPPQQGRMRFRD